MEKRSLVMTLLLLTVALILVACGGKETPAPTVTTAEIEKTTAEETESPETGVTTAQTDSVTTEATETEKGTTEEATEEETTEEETTEEETEEEVTTEEETTAAPISVTIATYNIRHGQDVEFDWTKLAEIIRQSGADIIGLQEVDMKTNRIGGLDTMKGLSEATGYDYYYFASAMDFDGGQYGTAILSRYPLSETATTSLSVPGGAEPRAFGAATVALPNGTSMVILNTHLSYEETYIQSVQFNQLSKWIKKNVAENVPVVVTGDFNTEDFTTYTKLTEPGFALVNNEEHRYPTFRNSATAIDNIVYRASCLTPVEHGMIDSDRSDHNLLWCRFELH